MSPEIQSLDEFLGERGLSSPVSDFLIDKVKFPHGLTQRKRKAFEKEAEEAERLYSEKRKAATDEYKRLLAAGKIKAPSTIERLIKTAQGHEDNAATHAARRALEKRGIDWQLESSIKPKEQNMRFSLICVDHEKDGLVDGAWMQDFTGTLEEASECARETERANSNRISVAVVEDMYYTPFSNVYGAKRLDITQAKSEIDITLNFEEFKDAVRNKGGIWTGDNVHFMQFRDGYSASYKPSFPDHSPGDCAISYNFIKDEWRHISPQQYDAEYNSIRSEKKSPLDSRIKSAELRSTEDLQQTNNKGRSAERE